RDTERARAPRQISASGSQRTRTPSRRPRPTRLHRQPARWRGSSRAPGERNDAQAVHSRRSRSCAARRFGFQPRADRPPRRRLRFLAAGSADTILLGGLRTGEWTEIQTLADAARPHSLSAGSRALLSSRIANVERPGSAVGAAVHSWTVPLFARRSGHR